MFFKNVVVLLTALMYCDAVTVYSSFWAPLFDRRILNYRVDAKFDPEVAVTMRDQYKRNFGYRGEKLIADLGNGKGLSKDLRDKEVENDIRFYYTYPGANFQSDEKY